MPLRELRLAISPHSVDVNPNAIFNELWSSDEPKMDYQPAPQRNNQIPLLEESRLGSKLRETFSQRPLIKQDTLSMRVRPNVSLSEHDYYDDIDHGKWLVSHSVSSIPHGDKFICELLRGSMRTTLFWDMLSHFPDITERLCSSGVESTVFVPSNEAIEHFNRPLDRLSDPILRAFVEYHIAPGVIPVSQLIERHTIETLLQKSTSAIPERISIHFMNEKLSLNMRSSLEDRGSNIVARNGLIHLIDKPLSQPPQFEILINQMKQLSIFKRILDKTQITGEIKRQKPDRRLTIFAFTDSAYEQLHPWHRRLLNSNFGIDYASSLVRKHMINGALYSDGFQEGDKAAMKTWSGGCEIKAQDLNSGRNRVITINSDVDQDGRYQSTTMVVDGSANVIIPNMIFDGGVIHVVDGIFTGSKRSHTESTWTLWDLWDEMGQVYGT